MIFLSAGHNPHAKGAFYGAYNEYDIATRWVKKVKKFLEAQGRQYVVVPTGTLGNKINFINKRANPATDVAIELHFNDEPTRRASGSETLYAPGSTQGKTLAETFQRAFELNHLFMPNRGAKEGWFHGVRRTTGLRFLTDTSVTAVILEPEFIYNIVRILDFENDACGIIASVLHGKYH